MGHGRLQSRLSRLERFWAAEPRSTAAPSPTGIAPPLPQLADWVRQYLPGYFTRSFSRFHHWLVGQLQDLHRHRNSRLALVAPRGSAKSTWVSLAYPLWAALNRHEPYILLISDSQGQPLQVFHGVSRLELNCDTMFLGHFLDV